ncbi:MAG TPA: DUF4405 domain-containing protein [Bacteroidales bacterium]|nr:DUF4405 domain-containing protein [Bacteroidales bacterium]
MNSQNFQCPRGFIDCKGRCGLFVDADSNGYCDYTILSDEALLMIKAYKDSIMNIKNKNKQLNLNNKIKNTTTTTTTTTTEHSQSLVINNVDKIHNKFNDSGLTVIDSCYRSSYIKNERKITKCSYPFISIAIPLILIYILSLILVSKKIITKRTQRKFWNILLLLTFIITGLSGLIMVIMINYGFWLDILKTFLLWHVIFGVVMAFIGIFHLLWHLTYYKQTINKIFKKV